MLETQDLLGSLNAAFDPLGANSPQKPAEAVSLLGLTDLNLASVRQLRSRLIGETKINAEKIGKKTKTQSIAQLDTPAEEGLKQVRVSFLK